MNQPQAESEWTQGWRIVLACAIANGTGISLVFYCFSMFLLPMSADLGFTRAETGMVQSLIVTAALGAPLIGRLTDRFGFRPVYTGCAAILALVGVAQGLWVTGLVSFAITVTISGFLGGGSTSITLTQPINAHFRRYRGRALGLVGTGVSVTAIVVPPLLQALMAEYSWRAGFLALAALGGLVGLPIVLLMMPRIAATGPARRGPIGSGGDRSFFRERDFWLLALANMLAGVATNGAISQLVPMISEHGLSAATAALGLSAFAAGQFVGKLGGGWLLDRYEPRLMAALMTLIPGCGFLLLWQAQADMAAMVLVASAMIGALSGADIDIYAYFTARRFGLARYGTVFGALHGLGWLGTVGGIVLFSRIAHETGSYGPAQLIACGLLVTAALFLIPVRLADRTDEETGSSPAGGAAGALGGNAQSGQA